MNIVLTLIALFSTPYFVSTYPYEHCRENKQNISTYNIEIEKLKFKEKRSSKLFCPACKKGSIDIINTKIFQDDIPFSKIPINTTSCLNCKESFVINVGSRYSIVIIEIKPKKIYFIECPTCKKSYLKKFNSRMGGVPCLCASGGECNPAFFAGVIPYSGGASLSKTLIPEKNASNCDQENCSGKLLTELFSFEDKNGFFVKFKLNICEYYPH